MFLQIAGIKHQQGSASVPWFATPYIPAPSSLDPELHHLMTIENVSHFCHCSCCCLGVVTGQGWPAAAYAFFFFALCKFSCCYLASKATDQALAFCTHSLTFPFSQIVQEGAVPPHHSSIEPACFCPCTSPILAVLMSLGGWLYWALPIRAVNSCKVISFPLSYYCDPLKAVQHVHNKMKSVTPL